MSRFIELLMRSDFGSFENVGDLLEAVMKVVDEFFNVRDPLAESNAWIFQAKLYAGKYSECIVGKKLKIIFDF